MKAQYEGKVVFFIVCFITGLIIFNSTFFIVGAGEEGVIFDIFTGLEQKSAPEGIHILVPFIKQGVKYSTKIQREDETASAASKDLQVVSAQVAVNFHPIKGVVYKLHQNIGSGYHSIIIEPAIQEAIKATTAQFTAEELVTKREEVKLRIREELEDRLKDRFLVIDDIQIVNLDFSPQFNAAIEAKVLVQQQSLQAENELSRVEIMAKQKVAEAEGEARSTVLRAEAEAESTRARGKAEADAIRMKNEALKESPRVVEYEYATRWNGQLPVITGGTMNYLNAKDYLPVVGGG